MLGKLILFAGLAGIAGYIGLTASKHDPAVFPYSKAQVESMLVDAKVVLPRRDGPGEIKIWSDGRIKRGVKLNMRYAQEDWAPLLECRAVIEVMAHDKTRVTPDCSSGPTSDSALRRTEDALRAPMFEEFIQATLNQRAFDRSRVDGKEMAAVFNNMGGMQREALKQADEAQRASASQ
jgi:hypothetical protein